MCDNVIDNVALEKLKKYKKMLEFEHNLMYTFLTNEISNIQSIEWPESCQDNIDAAIVHLDCARQNIKNALRWALTYIEGDNG